MSTLLSLRPAARGTLGACAVLLGLAAAGGCGDDFADPIVRVAQSSNGGGGSGGKGDGDTGDLCSPCGARSDCKGMESCVELDRGGNHFCSHACGGGNGHCPSGYVCSDVYNVSSMQCVPETGDCDHVVP